MQYKVIRFSPSSPKGNWKKIWSSDNDRAGSGKAVENQLWFALRRYFRRAYGHNAELKILWLPVSVLRSQVDLAQLKENTDAEKIILVADGEDDTNIFAHCTVELSVFAGEIDVVFGKHLTATHLKDCFNKPNIEQEFSLLDRASKNDSFISKGRPGRVATDEVEKKLQDLSPNDLPLTLPKSRSLSSSQAATQPSTANSWWYTHFGPTFEGTRTWLLLTALLLLAIVLLGGFAYLPLAAVLSAVALEAFFGTLIITLKVTAFISFVATLTMGITGVINDYYAHEKGNGQYFFWKYAKDLWNEHFVQSAQANRNLLKLVVGCLLLAAMIALLACTCGAGLAIPVITAIVNFTASALATTTIFAGASWAAAIFLTVFTMISYDTLFDALESLFSFAEDNAKPKVKQSSYSRVGNQLQTYTNEEELKTRPNKVPTGAAPEEPQSLFNSFLKLFSKKPDKPVDVHSQTEKNNLLDDKLTQEQVEELENYEL